MRHKVVIEGHVIEIYRGAYPNEWYADIPSKGIKEVGGWRRLSDAKKAVPGFIYYGPRNSKLYWRA